MRRSPTAHVERRLEQLKRAAREAGVKLTHQRLEIFRELAGNEEHPDAATLHRALQQRVPTVSLDTVYRTLWMLHDLGLVSTLGAQREGLRFDANPEPHHHYVCVGCGLVRDFASPALNALTLPRTLKTLGSILQTQVEVRGLCLGCQQRQSDQQHEQKQ